MLDIETENLPQQLEHKTHYVINHTNKSIIFNNRIKKRYAAYYSTSTNVRYNQLPQNK